MRYIVTDKTISVDGYKVVNKIMGILDDCDGFIFSKSVATGDTEILEALKLKDKVEKKIYIKEDPNELVSSLFKSMGGVVFDNEDILEDEELLDYVFGEGYVCESDDVVEQAVKVLEKCLADVQDSDTFEERQLYRKELWRNELQTAIECIREQILTDGVYSYEVAELLYSILNKLDVTAEGVAVDTGGTRELEEAIATLKDEYKKLQETFEQAKEDAQLTRNELTEAASQVQELKAKHETEKAELEQEIESLKSKTTVTGVEGTKTMLSQTAVTAKGQFRLKYQAPSTTKKIIYIKEYSECRYLTTFILCFREWLRAMKKKEFKIVILIPDEQYLHCKYKRFPKIDEFSVEFLHGPEYGVCTMTDIRKGVLDEVINHSDVGVIFIDKTYDEKQLIEGVVVHKYNATGNISVLENCKLKPQDTFMSITGVEGSMVIPHFENYAEQTNTTAKKAVYNACIDMFKGLSSGWGV